jgi:DNA-binding MarR family transcriptional regulator
MNATKPSRAQIRVRGELVEATAFLYTIVDTANRVRAARDFSGSPALRFDRGWALLQAIERCGGCPSIADVARLLRMTRQSAGELVRRAERTGAVELFAHPQDRRVIQVALSPLGRQTLETYRYPDIGWIFTLLNGLEAPRMRSTAHVLHVIARRLDRYASDFRASRSAGARRRLRQQRS